ncbi:MAG: hypothetical protein H7230_01085 [Candidatus Parcubacteria bacterium]|nr:hypothetical protein [Candidatus Paceibacterota bacterium]
MANIEKRPKDSLGDHIKNLSLEKALFIGPSILAASIFVAIGVAYISDFYNNPISGDAFTDADTIVMVFIALALFYAWCAATFYTFETPPKKD